jgi:ligand-binding sensor domain-containing protein
MKSGWSVCAVVLLSAVTAFGGSGTWNSYTSMQNVRSVVRAGDAYWGATSGGLFRWTPASDSYFLLRNAEGLQTIDLTAVCIDTAGTVWTGAANGAIQRYSPTSGTISPLLDIATANQTNKRINAISVTGDTALFSTEFGLSLFRIGKFEFGDTYSRFGTIPTGTRTSVTSALIHNGSIWACVSDGQTNNRVAVASLSNPNLLPPESWTLHTVGSASTVPRVLAVFNGRLFVGTSSGLFYFAGNSWTAVADLSGRDIVGLASSGSVLLAVTNDRGVFSVSSTNAVTQMGNVVTSAPSSITASADGRPVVGTTTLGLLTIDTAWTSHMPNGPNANTFLNVSVDPEGIVWCASGDYSGYGLFRFDGTTWTSFTTANSKIPSDAIYRTSVGCDGTVYASSYGHGLLAMPKGKTTIDSSQIYYKNVGMPGLAGDSNAANFVVVSNAVCDSKGNVWITIVLAGDKNILGMRSPAGKWTFFPAMIGGNKMSTLMDRPVDKCLGVDAFDNIWSIVREGGQRGVISLGNAGTIDSTAAFHVTEDNGLPSSEVKTLVVDNDNDIWIGTDRGIAIILEPSNPLRTGAIAAYKPLNGLVVNTIAIDPLNQKWVGTTSGAFLLSPDGTQTLASYTVESTGGKLMDNDVKSIAVDSRTGTVYFATLSGLASLTTPAAAPRESFDKLKVYPNPYIVPSSIPLSVSGLVANSELKIVTVDGALVRTLKTPGGLIGTWDGLDSDGKPVASGIYLIIAYGEDGSAVTTGKVAVIHK